MSGLRMSLVTVSYMSRLFVKRAWICGLLDWNTFRNGLVRVHMKTRNFRRALVLISSEGFRQLKIDLNRSVLTAFLSDESVELGRKTMKYSTLDVHRDRRRFRHGIISSHLQEKKISCSHKVN